MLVTVHAVSGAAISSIIPNPLIAIPVAFASHFVLDAIPHWTDEEARKKLGKHTYTLAVTDFLVATVAILLLVISLSNTTLAVGAISGSVMDIDAMFYDKKFIDIFKTPLPKPLSRLHGRVQNETKSLWGLVSQLLILTGSLAIIAYYA